MAISDIETETPERSVTGPRCACCAAIDSLPDDQAAALERLLRDKRWQYRPLSQRLAADPDFPIRLSISQLGSHIRGDCRDGEPLR